MNNRKKETFRLGQVSITISTRVNEPPPSVWKRLWRWFWGKK